MDAPAVRKLLLCDGREVRHVDGPALADRQGDEPRLVDREVLRLGRWYGERAMMGDLSDDLTIKVADQGIPCPCNARGLLGDGVEDAGSLAAGRHDCPQD